MINADDMQSWAYLLAPTFQFLNTAGKPLTEGWLEVYIAGTRNKYYCASDFDGTLHPFQIPLDSLGANIVLADPSQAYDVYVYNKFGSLIMSRYHVFPSHGGGSSVLNITIESEDGTVIVNNDGNGNFDLSIKPTVDKLEDLINIVSGISTSSTVGYAIGHAYTVNLDNTINLINDSVSGIDYTQDMTGYRLKSGHVYQFNYNAKFECGENDRYCSGKFYLEGPDSIAQEWKFNLDDSYYHSQSFNGATVLVTPTDLQYYDVKLKYAWDVDYTNPPDIDLNKISIVDITGLILNSRSYTGASGVIVNDVTHVVSVDMDYINNHLDIDATEIIASAVNIATGYTNVTVSAVSGELVDLINEVSASIPEAQVQSNWTETDTSSKAYIQNKPDEATLIAGTNISIEVSGSSAVISTVNVATIDDVSAVSGYLQNEINNIPPQVQSNWTETNTSDPSYIQNKPDNYNLVAGENIGISVSGVNIIISASGTDLTNYATLSNVSAVSSTLQTEIETVSGQIPTDYVTHNDVSAVSGNLVELVNQVSASIPSAQVNADWNAVSGKAEILNKPEESELIAGACVSISASGNNYVISAVVTGSPVLTGYATEVELETVSGNIVSQIPDISGLATNADLQIVSAAIPDVSIYATTQTLSTVSGTLNNKIDNVSAAIPDVSNLATKNEVQTVANDVQTVSAAIPDVSNYATRTEVNTVSGTIVAMIPDTSNLATKTEVNSVSGTLETEIQIVSAAIPDVSNLASKNEVFSVSGTIQTEVMAISGVVSGLPTAVPSVIAGSGINVTASGTDYIVSCTVTGGGESYNAGDYIGITDNTISVTGITDLVAGNSITITASGNSAIISSTGEAQVQSDWNVTDTSSKAYIKNKPTIPAAQVQSNWNETNTSSKAYIQNKPTIHTYTGASGISISSDVVTLDNPIGLVAVSGIEITVSGTSAIISASGIMDVLGDVETALSNL